MGPGNLVRRVGVNHHGVHPAVDGLRGKQVYGNYTNSTDESNFSVAVKKIFLAIFLQFLIFFFDNIFSLMNMALMNFYLHPEILLIG